MNNFQPGDIVRGRVSGRIMKILPEKRAVIIKQGTMMGRHNTIGDIVPVSDTMALKLLRSINCSRRAPNE